MLRATLLSALCALAGSASPQAPIGSDPPRLVLVLSIDQFRGDYLQRFSPLYLPTRSRDGVGGLRWLLERGAAYLDAHHAHVPTYTGPGHAVLLTGALPSLHGIVGNEWYDPAQIDWTSPKAPSSIYCVSDPGAKTIGGNSAPVSPLNLKVTTVGDELKMATNGKAKVVGVAYKDRASILMAGHAADTVIWMDDRVGDWVSSSAYCRDGRLPRWVSKLNEEDRIDRHLGQWWEPVLPLEAYALTRKAPAENPPPAGKAFRHALGSQKGVAFYKQFVSSGYGNDYVVETVERAVEAEALGKDPVPDLLVVNFSTNDYAGHRFGPNSPEVLDVTVRTDRAVARLLRFLDRSIAGGLGEVAVVLTADHGVVPIPEEAGGAYGTGAIRSSDGEVSKAVESALAARFGEGKWCWYNAPHLYLNRPLIAKRSLDRMEVERAAAEAAMSVPGIVAAYTRTQLSTGAVPDLDWATAATKSYHPPLSGDVLVFEAPGALFSGGTGTSHGSPWAYDTHVPIVFAGKGIRAGRRYERVSTTAIAPTLCQLLGIEYPTGCTGRVLPGALGG